MLELVNELLSQKHEKGFMANKVAFKCESCGHTERTTYYKLFKDQQFEVLEPAHVLIQNGDFEEEVPATPIKFKTKCPNCGSEIEAMSPVPLEYVMNSLQSPPPDDIMYG